MTPPSDLIKPRISLSSVLLPAPLGPSTATNSPRLISRLKSSSIFRPPSSMVTFLSVITGSSVMRSALECLLQVIQLVEHPCLVRFTGRHGFPNRHNRNVKRFGFILHVCRDGRDGLVVKNQYFDLLVGDLIVGHLNALNRWIVAFGNRFFKIKRRKHVEPHLFGLIEINSFC